MDSKLGTPTGQLVGSIIKRKSTITDKYDFYEVTGVTTSGNIVVKLLAYLNYFDKLETIVSLSVQEHLQPVAGFEYLTLDDINNHFPTLTNNIHVSNI